MAFGELMLVYSLVVLCERRLSPLYARYHTWSSRLIASSVTQKEKVAGQGWFKWNLHRWSPLNPPSRGAAS